MSNQSEKFSIKSEHIPVQFQKIKIKKINFFETSIPVTKIINIEEYSVKNYKISSYFKKISKLY
jgi:hypothetical protein